MTEKMVKALEAKGFKRWTKGDYDRLYANPADFGLEVERYKSGNISYAEVNGEKISNSEASKILTYTKVYIDVTTGELVVQSCRNDDILDNIKRAMDEAEAEMETEEKKENEEKTEMKYEVETENGEWNYEECQRMCEDAGLSEEWAAADGETFERVIYKAAEILGVKIFD